MKEVGTGLIEGKVTDFIIFVHHHEFLAETHARSEQKVINGGVQSQALIPCKKMCKR